MAIALLIAFSPYYLAKTPASASRPNIIIILADDLGYGDLGCYGCRDIRTPHLDRLATQGVRFTNFYANGPECTPTRAALLTGRYQHRVGGLECAIGLGNVDRYDDAIRLRGTNDLGLPVEEVSLARLLKAAGYATALSGKWHLGYEDKFSPNRHGFDEAFYCLGGGMDYFRHIEDPAKPEPALRVNGKPVRRTGYFTDQVAEEAVRFVRARRDKPFFLYVAFTAPHAPYQGPKDEKAADPSAWKQGQAPPAVYAAMVERMDEAVGRILAALNDGRFAANTLVVFTSDNGGTASARPTPLRGHKGSTFEGGIRVPCIVRWPGVLPAKATTDQVAISMDLTASLARAAGTAPQQGRAFDGIDVLSRIETGQPATPRTLFWRARWGEADLVGHPRRGRQVRRPKRRGQDAGVPLRPRPGPGRGARPVVPPRPGGGPTPQPAHRVGNEGQTAAIAERN
jgi:N-acetylgalactosamine-6-sulfatase